MNKNIIVTTVQTILLISALNFVALDFSKLMSMNPEQQYHEAQQLCNLCNTFLNDPNLQEAVNTARLACNHQFHPDCLKNTLMNGSLTCPTCQAAIEVTAEILSQAGFSQEELFRKLRTLNRNHALLTAASHMLFTRSGLQSFHCVLQLPERLPALVSFQNNRHEPSNIPRFFPIQDENVIFLILIFAVIFSTLRGVYPA